jgi:hypothetical protein
MIQLPKTKESLDQLLETLGLHLEPYQKAVILAQANEITYPARMMGRTRIFNAWVALKLDEQVGIDYKKP